MKVRCPCYKICGKEMLHCRVHEFNDDCVHLCSEHSDSRCQPVELKDIMKKMLEKDEE